MDHIAKFQKLIDEIQTLTKTIALFQERIDDNTLTGLIGLAQEQINDNIKQLNAQIRAEQEKLDKLKTYKMDHYIELKDSALTEEEKVNFVEKVYSEKVTETKLIKKGNFFYIKGLGKDQLPATIDFYYINAMKLEFNPAMAYSDSPWINL